MFIMYLSDKSVTCICLRQIGPFFKMETCYLGIKIFNSLPTEIKDLLDSPIKFKAALNLFFIHTVFILWINSLKDSMSQNSVFFLQSYIYQYGKRIKNNNNLYFKYNWHNYVCLFNDNNAT
jgi:hypothetical protein